MDEDDGMLSAGFAIDTQGAFSELQRFYQFFDTGTIKVLDEMRKVEVATGGMMQLSGATREVAAFSAAAKDGLSSVKQVADTVASGVGGLAATISTTGAAATREARDLARAKSATAKEVEGLIRSLDRETSALGMTKEQLRSARIETAALAAASHGNTDGADRLLASARANRAVVEGRAQDQTEASTKIERALEQEAQAVRSADHAYQLFQVRVREGVAAMKAEQAVAAENALAVKEQQLRSASHAYDLFEAAARRGSAAMKAEQAIASENALAAREQQLRSASHAYDLFEAAARRGAAAMKAEQAIAAENTLAAKEQQLRSASLAYNMFEAAARRGSAAMREQDATAERDAASLAQLRAMIDPAAAAQERLNREISEARRVMTAAGASAEGRGHACRSRRTEHPAA
jgi:hypothetical protein